MFVPFILSHQVRSDDDDDDDDTILKSHSNSVFFSKKKNSRINTLSICSLTYSTHDLYSRLRNSRTTLDLSKKPKTKKGGGTAKPLFYIKLKSDNNLH